LLCAFNQPLIRLTTEVRFGSRASPCRRRGWFLQRQDPEHALVNPPQRFPPYEALQRLDTERELPERETALGRQPASAQPVEVLGQSVLGTVNDAQVLGPAALHGGFDCRFT
jgi:hypothetical protein